MRLGGGVLAALFVVAGAAVPASAAVPAVIPVAAAVVRPDENEPDGKVVTPEELRGLIAAAEAAAYVGCGSSCDFKNPATHRNYTSSTSYYYCSDDGVTIHVSPRPPSNFVVELRYSPRCRTVWARVVSDSYYPTIKSYYSDGRLRTSASGWVSTGLYTLMLNDKNLLGEACAVNGPTTYCTYRY